MRGGCRRGFWQASTWWPRLDVNALPTVDKARVVDPHREAARRLVSRGWEPTFGSIVCGHALVAGHLATSFRRVYGAMATSWAAQGFVLMSGEPPGPAGSIGYAWEGAGAVRHATPSYTRV